MKHTVYTILAAGALGTVAFDAFGQGLAPLLGFAKLAPVGLAGATIKSVFGATPAGSAYLLHVFTGLFAYTLGYFLIARPVQQRILPSLPWLLTSVAYGVGLWVFALYGVAHFVAGMKPFLGFTGITWVALWGHILFAVVAAWVMEAQGIIKTKQTDATLDYLPNAQ